jgi:hypothetical protein
MMGLIGVHRGFRRLAFLAVATIAMRVLGPGGGDMVSSLRPEPAGVREEGTEMLSRVDNNGPAKALPVNVDLGLDLKRVERKGTEREVYDLFSRPSRPARSAPSKPKPAAVEIPPKESPAIPPSDTRVEAIPAVQLEPAPPAPPPPVATAAVSPPPAVPVAPSPAPATVAAPAPLPPPPTAPPLPFSYVGRIEEAGKAIFFLTKGDKLYTVKVGDDIEGIYTVEGIVAGQLKLTYKPLNIAQTLAVGAS